MHDMRTTEREITRVTKIFSSTFNHIPKKNTFLPTNDAQTEDVKIPIFKWVS